MKNITSFFKNMKNVFITLILIFNIHFSFSQVDLRTCGFACTSNNYTLTDVYLSLTGVNGVPITNTTCTIGQVQQVYIYLNYSSNSNSSIHFARLNSDLTIGGTTTFLNVLLGDIVPGSNTKLIYGPFNWTCGDELSLTNTIIAWKTNSNNDPGPNYQCSSFSNSQCDFTNSFIISKPLAVQFTYKACKVGTNTTVSFTSTTNGGKTPYTYAWDFKNDGGVPDSTLPNPTYTYTTSNNTAKLTVTDSQNISNSYTLLIIEPAELMLSETHTNVGCSGGTSSITLNVTGGTPNYTYLWNTGATTKDLANVAPGTYTVTVTDSNNCTKQLSVTITSGDTIKPIVAPLPAPSTINCPNVPVFDQATATDNSGTVTSLTFVDVNTPGSCLGTYSITRTWTAKDACNNISLPVSQTINVVDNTPPTWTTAPTALNVTLECSDTAGLTAAQNQAPVATDACSTVTYTKTSGTFVVSPSCANAGTYTNTWIAKDVCNNSSTVFTQVITIQDTTVPTWTTAPSALNVTLECSDAAGLTAAQASTPVATDSCSGTVTYTKTSGTFIVSLTCANAGTYTNTWVAKDVCNNSSTIFTQVITIQDTTVPTWTTAPTALNVTLECSDAAGLTTAQNQAPIATDSCSGTVTYAKTSGPFVVSPSCANAGTYTNTWIAKDVCNNSSTTFTQVITIQDTTVPTWTTAPTALNVTLECSDAAGLTTAQSQTPVATDSCSGTVTYTKTSGTFIVSPSCANAGTYTNTWIAKDVCNNSSTIFTQVITIQDTTPPTWTTAPTALNVTLQCSDAAGLTAAQASTPVATDSCSGTVTYTKTSGTFVVSPSCANAGTYTNTWIAKDVCNNSSTTFTQVITIQDTTVPTWTTAPTALNVTLECSDAAGLTTAQNQAPIATDSCSGTVTYTKTSGIFVVSPSCANAGTYTNTWIAKDVCNNSSTTFTQVITIQDTTVPTWTTAPTALNVTLECSDAAGLTTAQNQAPIATDSCSGTVTYTKTSGTFIVSPSCANAGTYTNTWIAKDVCNNSSTTFTQVITIQDTTVPTWTTAPTALNVTLECSDAAGLTTAQSQAPVATDSCSGTVTYTKTSGTFIVSPTCANAGTYTNTWVAKDVCNNSSTTFTQVITIQDTTVPTWTTAPTALDVTLQCSDTNGLNTAQASAPVATDNCSGTVTYTKTSGVFQRGACGSTGTYTNTWTATDVCNNTSSIFTQVITIQDTAIPTWVTAPTALDVTLECSDTAGLTTAQNQAPTATANCSIVTYTKTSGQFLPSQSCSNAGTYTNTWVAKDDCGNTTAAFTQIITIQDTTAPTWTTAPTALNVTLECSDTAGLTTAQADAPVATDNCSGTVTYTKTSGAFVVSQTCANAGTYTNTWIAKDVCNNSSTIFTQVITIQDTTVPTWTTAPTALNVILECSDAPGLTTAQADSPVATDNCSGTVTYTKTSGTFVVSSTCANAGTYTNTWIAKDICNNSSTTFTQVITIQDTTVPTWTTAPTALNVTLECSDTAGLTTAQADAPIATDSCNGTVTYTKTSGTFVVSPTCANAGTYTNTWVAKDICNNSSIAFTQVITIQDTTAPIWTTAPTALDVTLQCSDTNGLNTAQADAPVATDNCGTVTYTKTSGVLQRGACGSTGTYTNTWIATDVCNNASSIFTQVITIQDTAIPTWITQVGALNVTLQCSDAAGLTTAQNQAPTATANCSIVTYTKTSGQFLPSQSCSNAGTYTNTWIAKDDCGNTTAAFTQVITIEDTTKPTWTTAPTDLNVTLQCSDAAGLTTAQANAPIATDNCDSDVTNIVKVSGLFVASQSCGNSGTYTNTWTVTDNCGNLSDTFTQIITIEDTTKPTWTTAPTDLNVTLQCSDAAGLTTAQANAPIATDNCDSDVTNIVKVSGLFVASQSCGNSGTYTNTWTVTDNCGNVSDTFTQVITIEDTTAPTWTTVPTALNVTLECSDAAGLTTAQSQAPIATDSCSGTVTYTKTSGTFVVSPTCANAGTYTNTWVAKDVCNNSSTIFTQVITIQDTTAPTWTTAPTALNVTLQCSDTAGLNTAQADAPVATDNCSGTVTYTKTSGVFQRGACGSTGTYTNTWIAKDVCNNSSSIFTQVITVQDTAIPTWVTAPTALNVTLQCSDTAGLTAAQNQAPTATANCSIVTYTKTSGQFLPSQSCSNAGTYTNTWVAKDDCGNTTATFTQVITIEDTTKPTWTTAPTALNVTLQCSDASGLTTAQTSTPIATDNCDSDVTNIVKVSGQFVASESCGNSGTYTNTWTVTDNCGNLSDTFTQIITIEDTTKPTWTTAPTALNVTLQCSDASGLTTAQTSTPIATDNCDSDVANIVKVSGQFVASESCGNSGTYTNTWTVTDNCGNLSDTFTQVITIEDTTKPTWTTAPTALNVTLQCSDASGLTTAQTSTPIATDNCDSDVANIVKVSGQFVASESCGNSGTYTNTWTVTDNCGNLSDTFTQVITIEDTTKPTWTTAPTALNVTLQCSDASGLTTAQTSTPIATDNCDSDVANIVKVSGQFVASESCGNSGTYTNTWTVTDNCGNLSDTFTQVITIEDTTKPTWTTQAGSLDIKLQCSDASGLSTAQASTPIATDNCDGNLINIVKTSGQFVASESCANAGTYTNTWTVTDNCGNASDTFTQVITIEDTTKPTFNQELPADITVSCDKVPEVATITASDNCNVDVPVVYSEVKSNIENECSTNYTLTRKWTTSDCSGNTTSFTQVITVKDTTPPTGTAPADITNLNSISDIPVADPKAVTDAADNCSQTVNITVSDSNNGGTGCAGSPYILTRTYTLSDCAGNTTILVQTITISHDVIEPRVFYPSQACNADDSTVDLFVPLPRNTTTVGTWIDTDNTHALQGNTVTTYGLPVGTYNFEYQIQDEVCPRSLFVTLAVNDDCKVLACGNIVVHNAFSPNGDSFNNKFVIDNIEDTTCYPDNSVEIYNRWGILVFETRNYNNTTNAFDGFSRGRTTVSQPSGLPTGTYFYILNYTSVDGNGAIQTNKKDGFLYLTR
ncbi:gliding motility-associated C-terminal domain-containing protein [Flavobacterium sp. F-65]|uniref:Gliding motility-associated C-terminal domain-containing protein n=1 Tax=Flavobacterium pisciphilum TaxID=2893755 RepID=A0ABS8MP14_9FLAO|nr:Ig-like domain-containing protein [Flavobacterium sp. F-65]MCC9070509.1 gliding motility-associated C-terminal domain-containing protein [Flavobacterium sp. F-65]